MTANAAPAASAAPMPALQVVAEWNRLPFELQDATAQSAYEKNATYKKVLLQGVKVDAEGNMYVSTARWGGADVPATLSKLVRKDGHWVLQPYPSEAMNKSGDPTALQAVLGFEIDRNDVMWILDQGHVAGAPSAPGAEKLILWDIKHDREIQRHVFSDAETDKKCSFLNDVVVDNDHGFAYLTDSGINCDPLDGGLIVYQQKTNTARRILDRTAFTMDEPGFQFRIDATPVLPKTPMRTGADGIALSGDKRTLYWTNLTGHALYAIDTSLLRDFNTTPSALQTAVRRVTTLPSNTDGMVADRQGHIYMTALELNGLMRFDEKTGQVSTYISDPTMGWPDTIGWGAHGDLYFTTGHLNQWVAGTMNFDNPKVPNFRIWKVSAPGESYNAK